MKISEPRSLGGTFAASLAAITLCGLLFAPLRMSHAGQCVAADLFGDCFLKTRNHLGDLPFAVTVAETDGDVIVVDLYSGLFHKYDKVDISAVITSASLVGPFGSATYTGIEWYPPDNKLYWVVDDGAGQVLAVTDLTGDLESTTSFDLTALVLPLPPVIGDFTYHLDSGNFWAVDIANDIYFEFDTDGVATGSSFASPGLTGFGGGAYGLGITAVPTQQVAPIRFDLPVGFPVDLRAARVVRHTDAGAEFGLVYDLGADNSLTGWVAGLAWSDSGSVANIEAEFVTDVTNNKLIEVRVENPNARSVTGLTCVADADNNVDLSWSNPISYTSIKVLRKLQTAADTAFVEIASIAGTSTSYTDSNLDDDSFTYRIRPVPASSVVLPGTFCSVTVGPGRLINIASHEGEDALGIAIAESNGNIYVADLNSGFAHRYDKSLASLGAISNPFGTDTTTGIAWNSATDTLFWYNSDDSLLQETNLSGVPIGTAISLTSPFGGVLGDIAYDSNSDSFWAVDIAFNGYFEFFADGTIGTMFDEIDTGATSVVAEIGNGVTVVEDSALTLLSLTSGTQAAGRVERVRDVIANADGTASQIGTFLTGPSTLSGFVNGIAWTDAGSQNPPNEALYVVGNDTNAIYELNLASGVLNNFTRGDCNDDGANDVSDVTFLLFFLFGSSTPPLCFDACDFDDNSELTIVDVTFLLAYQFQSGPEPPAPFPGCGPDATPDDGVDCLQETCTP